MKQILQNLSSGESELVEAPAPQARRGSLLVDTTVSLISTGTERMLVDFGKSGLLAKARSQPEKVRQVLDKVATDGLMTTVDAVRSKLGQPLPLGYCNVGVVRESGSEGFHAGDRVVSNGKHADVVLVPKNLAARIPDGVSDEAAAFTVVASIGLQGIRLARPTLGEAFVVTGVGLIGLLTVQLLRAHGCRVLAIDFDTHKLELARGFGADTCNPSAGEDPIAAGIAFSRGQGVDGVIITASTKSSDPITQAARMSRKRGRIVLVGVTGLKLNRADFYEKELTFQVSCSYGPGRYDPAYEDHGQDYPLGFVRWTEQRNFEAVLDMLASGALNVAPLISHRVPFAEAPRAYELLSTDKSALGIVLAYNHDTEARHIRRVELKGAHAVPAKLGRPAVAFLGAGNYASRVLIPAFKTAGADLAMAISSGGISAVHSGRKFGFREAATDATGMLADASIDTVVIATRHDAHAAQVLEALRADKHVFCEKPLCLTLDELASIEAEKAARPEQQLMIGFNRRFAPHIVQMKGLLDKIDQPKTLIMTINAGDIPADHWAQDPEVGGGRIVGEGCHFIDLLRHLVGAPIVAHHAVSLGEHPAIAIREDKAVITLQFADGSVGVVNYLANGHSSVAKERLEVFAAGRVLQLDNFLRLKAHGFSNVKPIKLWKQDKGQVACATAFIEAVRGAKPAPVPAEELFEVSRISIEVAETLR